MARPSKGFILMSISLRLPTHDKRKSASAIKDQIEKDLRCCLDDCNKPLTMMDGPGKYKLCRDHQLQQREYGGMGRIDRPWSFSREWCCAWCGYSPKDDPWFDNPPIPWDDEIHKNRAMRSTLIGDHGEHRKTDGGGHGKDNVQTLCATCDRKKTNLYKDYQRSKYSEVNQE
jgi:hypothetical protein